LKIIGRPSYHRRLFFIAAIWNIAVAITLTSFSIFWKQALCIVVDPAFIPESMFWLQLFMNLVFCFGLGYYWVSQDHAKNHAVIVMAVIGKTIVFLTISYYLAIGHATILAFLLGFGDFIFAGLFVEDLIEIRKLSPT
jgi:hypothetical protein